MTEKILIFGAGALAREALQIIRDMQSCGSNLDCCGFFVDPEIGAPPQIKGLPVYRELGTDLLDPAVRYLIAVGDGRARARIAATLFEQAGPRFTTLVHPRTWLGASVTIGAGCILFGNTSATTDVQIAEHVVVNPGSTIAHDVEIGPFATLSPGVDLAGHVRLGEGCMVGTGATIIPRVAIGAWAIIGAGAVVLTDVPRGATAVGVPARIVDQGVDQG
jgi:sugar O-acyltransferase (sialic acid O-acetyltransferase NeuD family)